MRTIQHTTDIEAPPSQIWDILLDTAEYGEWNPFMTQLNGVIARGNRLTVTIKAGNRQMTFRPRVLAVAEGKLIRWRGRLGIRGIFDGDHELALEELGDGTTRFTQRETFSGILVPFLRGVLDDTEAGFADMNAALRSRATNRRSPASPATDPT